MENLYTLDYYNAAERGYHIQKAGSSVEDGRMHYHKHYHIGLLLSGRIKHRKNIKYALLLPGDCFVIPPGYAHSLHFLTEDTVLYSLCFDESLLPQGMLEGGLQQFLFGLQNETADTRVLLRLSPDYRQREALQALMDLLQKEQETAHLPELSCAPALICAVLYLLAQAYYNMPYNTVLLADITGHNSNIRRCVRYVDTHFQQKLTPEALAKRFGMSRAALCAAFSQHTGMSLHKYISKKRILEAQLQIRTKSGLPLSQISREVGYEDESTFYRNFLRITGMSPTDYRRQYREFSNSAYDKV